MVLTQDVGLCDYFVCKRIFALKAKMRALITPAVLLLLLSVFPGSEAEVLSAEDEQRLTSFIQKLMECRNIPGLTMTLVRGKEHKTISMGVSNMETAEPVDSKTLFYLGSLTQSFTSTLIGVLTQRSGNV
ncbi:beta-lactamase [Elysia marginata]|uniref:Beta-lactamase n=1 Tax=Elysia marginata TaxID=1093978 RepID=A0AAV4I2X2_9GAST|nr:beta-lactamase [Elysia marginata]